MRGGEGVRRGYIYIYGVCVSYSQWDCNWPQGTFCEVVLDHRVGSPGEAANIYCIQYIHIQPLGSKALTLGPTGAQGQLGARAPIGIQEEVSPHLSLCTRVVTLPGPDPSDFAMAVQAALDRADLLLAETRRTMFRSILHGVGAPHFPVMLGERAIIVGEVLNLNGEGVVVHPFSFQPGVGFRPGGDVPEQVCINIPGVKEPLEFMWSATDLYCIQPRPRSSISQPVHPCVSELRWMRTMPGTAPTFSAVLSEGGVKALSGFRIQVLVSLLVDKCLWTLMRSP